MKLYHGSTIAVKHPNIQKGRKATDFGKGFYTTTDFEQARKWAVLKRNRIEGGKAVVSVYDVPDGLLDSGFSVLRFSGATKEWLEFVVDMAERNNAIIAINGDYFTGSANDGPVIRNGVLYRDSIDRNRDACVLYQDGTVETYAPDEIDVEEMMARGAYQCWTFGPSLLDEEGQPKTEKSQFLSTVQRANPRSALGYVAPGHYLFVTVDGRGQSGSRGMTMAELSQLMYDLGCTVAYNLDGGGTAIMADQDGAISNQSNDKRRCSDILFIVEDVSAYQQATEEDE